MNKKIAKTAKQNERKNNDKHLLKMKPSDLFVVFFIAVLAVAIFVTTKYGLVGMAGEFGENITPENITGENITENVTIEEELPPIEEAAVVVFVENKNGEELAHQEAELKEDGTYEAELVDTGIVVKNLENPPEKVTFKKDFLPEKDERIKTQVVAYDDTAGKLDAEVTITLAKENPGEDIDVIYYCEDFDNEKLECSGEWEATGITFTQDENTVTFTATSFSAYGGGEEGEKGGEEGGRDLHYLRYEAEDGLILDDTFETGASVTPIGSNPAPYFFGTGYIFANTFTSPGWPFSTKVSINVNIPEDGDYYLWVRMLGEDALHDRIQIAIDGNFGDSTDDTRVYTTNTPPMWGNYEWILCGNTVNGGNGTIIRHLKAGWRTISISYGEGFVRADRFLITNDLGFVPTEKPMMHCGVLLNETVNLEYDLICPETGVVINNNGITLDCQGHYINYSTSGAAGYGIDNSGGYDNIVIKNCKINGKSSSGNSKYAVYFQNSGNSQILNNSITGLGLFGYGVYVLSSTNTLVFDNSILTTGTVAHGVNIESSSSIRVINNTINTTLDNAAGINFIDSPDSRFTGNIIKTTGSGSSGISLSAGALPLPSSSLIGNNTIRAEGNNGHGLYLDQLQNFGRIKQNNIIAKGTGGHGVYVHNVKNVSIIENSVNSSNSDAFFISGYSSNNLFQKNNIVRAGQDAIALQALTLQNWYPRDNVFQENSLSNVVRYDLNLKDAAIDRTYLTDQKIRSYYFYGKGSILYFKNSTAGQIKYLQPISGSGTDLSSDIQIHNNLISVDSSGHSGLNKSANLTFFNPGDFAYAVAYRNSQLCGSKCSDVTQVGNNYYFSVSQFTTYSVGEPIATDTTKPTITWRLPTPDPDSIIKNSYVHLNASVEDESNTSAFFDWDDSLRAYWSFEYYNSSGIFDNSSFNNFARFRSGMPTSNIQGGKFGNSLFFDVNDGNPVNYSIHAWPDQSLNISGPVSISLWVYPDTLSAGDLTLMHGNEHYVLWYDVETHKIHFRDNNNPGGRIESTEYPLTLNKWNHVVAVFAGEYGDPVTAQNTKIYVNGNSVADPSTASGSWLPNLHTSIDVTVGTNLWNGGPTFGKMDEIMIFSRALSKEEVRALYNNTAYWLQHRFDDLEDGTYDYRAFAIDQYGNLNITPQRAVTVARCNMNLTENYDLTSDLTCPRTAINIKANNVVLDCHGHEITYATADISGNGINNSGGYDYVTIKNCKIYEGAGETASKHAIRFGGGAIGGTIQNNTIETMGDSSRGISLTGSSNSNILTRNTITTNCAAAFGIYLYASTDSNITHNNITTSEEYAYGISFASSSNSNNISYNNVTTTGSNNIGIWLSFSSNTLVRKNILNTSDTSIYATSSNSNNITNNTVTASGADGIYVAGTSNRLINNTVTSAGNGIQLNGALQATVLTNSITASSDGMLLVGASNNNITSNTFGSVGGRDLYVPFAGSNGNFFIDQRIRSYNISGAGSILYFKNSTAGQIKFLQAISGIGSDLGAVLKIQSNHIEVNSVAAPGLNKRANLTFYNPSFSGCPAAFREGVACGAFCSNFGNVGTTYYFNVSQFTYYSVGDVTTETNCFDNIDNDCDGRTDCQDFVECLSPCTGNCNISSCSGAPSYDWSCSANNDACTGDCDYCEGSGTIFNCVANQSFCDDNYLCAECTGSVNSFSCTYDAGEDEDCGRYSQNIQTCDNDPDSIHFTWDEYLFTSQCAGFDSCTEPPPGWQNSITHTCSIVPCGAYCEAGQITPSGSYYCDAEQRYEIVYECSNICTFVDSNPGNNLLNDTCFENCTDDGCESGGVRWLDYAPDQQDCDEASGVCFGPPANCYIPIFSCNTSRPCGAVCNDSSTHYPSTYCDGQDLYRVVEGCNANTCDWDDASAPDELNATCTGSGENNMCVNGAPTCNQCHDGIDNDGDNLADADDPDCFLDNEIICSDFGVSPVLCIAKLDGEHLQRNQVIVDYGDVEIEIPVIMVAPDGIEGLYQINVSGFDWVDAYNVRANQSGSVVSVTLDSQNNLLWTANFSANVSLLFYVPAPVMINNSLINTEQYFLKDFNVSAENHFYDVYCNITVNDSFVQYSLYWFNGIAWIYANALYDVTLNGDLLMFNGFTTSDQNFFVNGSNDTCAQIWSCTPWSNPANSCGTRVCTCPCTSGTCSGDGSQSKECPPGDSDSDSDSDSDGDCESCPPPPPPPPKITCAEDWICQSWTPCLLGTQTRSCEDNNTCNTTQYLPFLSQDCVIENVTNQSHYYNWSNNTGGNLGGEKKSKGFDFQWWWIIPVIAIAVAGEILAYRSFSSKKKLTPFIEKLDKYIEVCLINNMSEGDIVLKLTGTGWDKSLVKSRLRKIKHAK